MPDLISAFLPLAALIALGFVLGRLMTMDLKTVAALAIFGFTPLVGFGAAAQMQAEPSVLLLPVVTFFLAALTGVSSFYIGKRFVHDGALSYLLPMATGSGNTGYLGLPVALALFGPDVAGIYMFGIMGVSVFESTIGYYYIVRGNLTRRQALLQVLKLPLLYALAAGLVLSALHGPLPEPFIKLWEISKGAYVAVGMMMIGLALAQQRQFSLSLPLLGATLLGRFLIWPFVAAVFVYLDTTVLDLFTPLMRNAITLVSLVPVAGNLAAFAAQNNLRVGQAASLILVTTVIAVLFLPFVLPLLLDY